MRFQTSSSTLNSSPQTSSPRPLRLALLLGLGIADITGPVVKMNMKGHASSHSILYSCVRRLAYEATHAFIIVDTNSSECTLLLNRKYGNTTYHRGNIALVGTHQHLGVCGYPKCAKYLLPQGTFKAVHPQSLSAIVDGALLAVRCAHNSLSPGTLSFGTGRVEGGSRNRSPTAYFANPADERARYPHAMSGNTTYVAGFVQGAVDDTSPNTLGAFCESPGKPYGGLPSVANPSTCGGRVQECHERGPAFTEDAYGFASSAEIGARQARMAGMTAVRGSVRSVHAYVDMSRYEFALRNGTRVRTCPAGMAPFCVFFPAHFSDGPGAFDFVREDNKTSQNPFWDLVKVFMTPSPSEEQVACQYPKPILLNMPYEWSPSTVDVQIFRVAKSFFGASPKLAIRMLTGSSVMLIIPGELTTMAGRRISEAIQAELISSEILGDVAHVVVAGTANMYVHYIATREYTVQRYEGASTLYEPCRLSRKYCLGGFANARLHRYAGGYSTGYGREIRCGAVGKHFGQTLQDLWIAAPYQPGETVFARFAGANLRASPTLSLRTGGHGWYLFRIT
ncbi:Neutral/alkaline nonlysosomal ceramidase [Mycena olivaceomarginata]|nr:Neutral/alkaline nonlysosomal ceramidase [Mycena olivaceomarginata]